MIRQRSVLRVAVLLLLASAIVAWWWLAPSRPVAGAAAPVAAPAAASAVRAVAAPASPASASRPPAAAVVEDARCVIAAVPSPAVADASASEASASAVVPDDAGRRRLIARLRSSPDPYANAVAIWLELPEDDDGRVARERQLAAMAADTRDPRLYSLALRACWFKSLHECQALSARRWSELDPDNAMPWLLMLDEAALRHDASGIQEALFHATHASRLAEREQAPLQAIVDAAGDDPESLVAARTLAIDAIGLAAAQVGPAAYRTCRTSTPADANLWQQCTALVDLLEHRSDSLSARRIGAAMDRRMTGDSKPMELVAAQTQRVLALHLVTSSSCADLRGKLALMRRMAVDGEAAVARDLAP